MEYNVGDEIEYIGYVWSNGTADYEKGVITKIKNGFFGSKVYTKRIREYTNGETYYTSYGDVIKISDIISKIK